MKFDSEVLLVDDNPADIDLTSEVLGKCQVLPHVNAVKDGVEAICFLQRQGEYLAAPRPDLILLDLNLPRKDGRAVLAEVKSDPHLSKIPIIVFTTSEAMSDIDCSYALGANCYLRKPGNLIEFRTVIQTMANFWLNRASLPKKEKR